MDEALAILVKNFLEENWYQFLRFLESQGEDDAEICAEQIIATLDDTANGR